MMKQTTTTRTNTPRRTHPAVFRAALRSSYDAAGRRTREDHYPDAAAHAANNAAKSITYTWNTLDRLTGYSDGTTSATYTFDAKQLRQIGESVNYGAFTLATGATHNALGQKASLTYPDGATYGYTYDTNNQLSTVNFPTGHGNITINSYLWIVPSRITVPGGTQRTLQYDGLLRLKDLGVKDPGQSQVMGYQYGYDLAGNIVAKATEAGTTNYGYDALDRLTGAAYTGQTTAQANESYSYDQVANRITDTRTAAATWAYDANNRLVTAGTISYSYDANGNTTNQTDSANPANTRNYVYDTDNRLIEARDANNTLIAAYSYDPFGRRLSKDTGTSKTYYFYSAEGLIAEADAAGQITKSYGYAPGSTFSTNPLWMRTASQSGLPVYYTYQNDHLGTPMKLLNQSGVTVWGATYDALGRAAVDPASTVSNNLRYPGQYYDAETGLHYNWNRYYDPSVGRYTTGDPIGLEGGVNLYTYVGGNPLSFTDPLGLKVFWNSHQMPSQAVVDLIEKIDECNGDRDVYVTSTIRDERTNKAAGGRPRSRHLTGGAADIYVPGQSSVETATQAVGVGAMGVGTYDRRHGGHTHIDDRQQEWNGHNSSTLKNRPSWRTKSSDCGCSK